MPRGGPGFASRLLGLTRRSVGEPVLSEPVFRLVEFVGTSGTSVSDAIQNAITRASSTIRNIRWFEVAQVRGEVKDGKVGCYQVTPEGRLHPRRTVAEGSRGLAGPSAKVTAALAETCLASS